MFVNIFAQLGGDLPTLTAWVVKVSDFLRGNFIIFPALFAVGFEIRKFKRTEQGRRLWDRIKLKIPMKIGQVVSVTLARFSRTLSTLITAGVGSGKAAPEITGQTSGNWVEEASLAHAHMRCTKVSRSRRRCPRTRCSRQWSAHGQDQ